MLSLTKKLLSNLHQNNIRYCHWKSNAHISRSLVGEGDLDVLISQENEKEFYKTIIDLDFKRLVEKPGKAYPGIEHWLGYSKKEGKLVHLHAHFRLVYGEKFIKGFRAINEETLLNRRILEKDIYMMSKSDELVFLFIRTIVKIDIVWLIKKILGKEKKYYPPYILEEYGYLTENLPDEDINRSIDYFLPKLDREEVKKAIFNIEKLGLWDILLWKNILNKNLSWSRRLSRTGRYKAFVKTYTDFLFIKLGLRKKKRKQFFMGGTCIAFLGADGAGKSTMLREINDWLGKHVDIEILYAGTGDGTKSFGLNFFDKTTNILKQKKRVNSDQQKNIKEKDDPDLSIFKYLYTNIRAILIARHRDNIIRKGSRLANNGAIILYDRYPQPFQKGYGDGPKILTSNNFVWKQASKWEQRIYTNLYDQYPEHAFIMEVSPKTSLARKGEDSEDVINAKNKVLSEIKQQKSEQTITIDANKEYKDVLALLKDKVWAWL
ncbi:MAG: hypothetical protein V3U92_11135 [Cellulophaga sp.]